MLTKALPAKIKAVEADEGVFEAIVATYDVDSIGDRIIPGAFEDTIAERKASGVPFPVIWSHKSDDPEYHIGYVLEAEERPEGLWVKAQLDMDDPKSRKVHKLLKGRRVTQFSFAYDEIDARPVTEKDDSGAKKELHKLKIYEVGPTLIGCNQATSLIDVKSDTGANVTVEVVNKISDSAAGLKAGRVLSKENEDIVEQIHALAAQLLAAVKGPADEDSVEEKATPNEPADPSDSQVADPPAAPETKGLEPADSGTAALRLPTPLDLQRMQLEADVEAYV